MISNFAKHVLKKSGRAGFSVEMTAVNKEFNKCKPIDFILILEIKISLAKSGHPIYFDNQATTPMDPR